MKSVSMGIDVQYLLGFLEDELKDLEEVRISTVAPSGIQKAQDLPQDYDPNENDIHLIRGVRVRVGSREYYFPASWVTENRLDLVHKQVKAIHEQIK